MARRPLVYAHRKNTNPLLDAAGAAAGHAQDASAGMTHWVSPSNEPWAWNPVDGEWQYIHTMKSGDTLWKLSGLYYGTSSLDGVHAIYGVPQNKAIQGPSPDSGLIPGDEILIPGLPQPRPAPATSDSIPTSLPDLPPSGPPQATSPGVGLPGPVQTSAPSGWPGDLQFPPQPVSTGSDINIPSNGEIVLPTTEIDGDVDSTDVSTTGGQPAFWTGGRIALAAGAGVVALGTIVWLATRKKRRRAA